MFEYNETVLKYYDDLEGYFTYRVPCGGIITSVEARGFCGRAENVELRLIYGVLDDDGYRHSRVEYIRAECNTSANYTSSVHEGSVRNDSLNIDIPSGGVLAININPDCSGEKCSFQPAIIHQRSNYSLVFADDHLQFTSSDLSLLFSANITGNNGYVRFMMAIVFCIFLNQTRPTHLMVR